uniref:Uncharacterized protein n=1 Tax=Anguilla anguilla TaxID=7936 RepID=A0A0E9WB11_ANGAN
MPHFLQPQSSRKTPKIASVKHASVNHM